MTIAKIACIVRYMKKKKDRMRNTVATRLNDLDYDAFIENTGRQYGKTLRELVQVYNANYRPDQTTKDILCKSISTKK